MKSPLRQARERRGMTIARVASVIGIDPSNLSRVERGCQVPSFDVAERLAKFFDGEVPEMQILYPHRHKVPRK
ncbi:MULTISPECIES: helix-turn-helix transcriptional regulator [unclassified Caballeronia]|uniref:helix-turn-helix domain-containing protein n=1 Tax=unclassified Caballeronia TaxID=2646786 RepID=UPI002865A657|nr:MULTISPECIES: helix-turn-helix transcriptional regulator [unclassified Caballeronia]MDR5775931.1 helix-turn-helix transcriptional regulator [Caballeronia sp. LZ002]MDR5801480.1 helix-turn-helix transcriptional regulator [Caballeronia sp. LZ001]MDR5851370.1 helix-turn-helix transcriptional regulator [Caballeronia sp. LZ003]